MYEKRFLCGVDGVNEEGKEVVEILFGGVWERVPSRGAGFEGRAMPWSGDKAGEDAWGTELSNSSARSSVEKVLFASSARRR